MERGGIVLKTLRTDEGGISLVEVLVASAMASIIATAFLLVFSSFSRGVSLEEARARALTEVQAATSQLASELRQAEAVVADAPPIETLDSAWGTAELVFYSDRADNPGPERYRYYLANCTATHCDLMRDVTIADSATPPWTYTGSANSRTIITSVVTGGPALFTGADWDSSSEVLTVDCDPSNPCDFSLVKIEIRVDPDPNLDAEEPLTVRQEVRLRNAG